MTPASKPEKPEWMKIAESDNASSNVRKVDKRLTLGTLVAVGAIVIAGSLFANASDESSAVADVTSVATPTTSASTSVSAEPSNEATAKAVAKSVATPKVSKIQAPAIAQMPDGDREHDEFGEEHEGRERRGEHHDRFEDHEDGDDD